MVSIVGPLLSKGGHTMKTRKLVLPLLLSASMAAFGAAPAAAQETPPGNIMMEFLASQPPCLTAAEITYETNGLLLPVPKRYDDLLLVEICPPNEKELFFRVSEKASMEAVKAQGEPYASAGHLFSIGSVDEAWFRQMICHTMGSLRFFARDNQNRHFYFYQLPDIRYFRENEAAMKRDQDQWQALNDWALREVRAAFCERNGLTGESYSNSQPARCVARAMYDHDVRFQLSAPEYGPLSLPNGCDPAAHLNCLLQDAVYERLDDAKAPDGDYVSLSFPGEDLRIDFFRKPGQQDYVRELRADLPEVLYRVRLRDEGKTAGQVMQGLYDDFAAARNEEMPGAEKDLFAGQWAGPVPGRVYIDVTKASLPGQYDVEIKWRNAANLVDKWTMTAEAAGDRQYAYKDCVHTEVRYAEDGSHQDTVMYENGTGRFTLTGDNQLRWLDDLNDAARDTVFHRI